MSFTSAPVEIYQGIRGSRFVCFLKNVLSLSNIHPKYYNVLLDANSLELYNQAFTHRSVDAVKNYEFFEFLGDTTINKAICWYLSRRFVELNCPDGVKVLTRLKINLISKRSFANFAKQLYFWDFVSADMDVRNTKMDKTLEDVFEAFFGVTEVIIDSRIQQGAGYPFCYNMVKQLMDTRKISLKYEDLFDAKTRLKETFDYFGDRLGKLYTDYVRNEKTHNIKIYIFLRGQKVVLGEGNGSLKSHAEQTASEYALRKLQYMGYSKPIPDGYRQICE